MSDAVGIPFLSAQKRWPSAKVGEDVKDEALEPQVQNEIHAVLERFVREHGSQNALRFDHVVTRRAGQRRYVDLHMHAPGHWSLAMAAELRGAVETALMVSVPGLHATISLLPVDVEAQAFIQEPSK